MLMFAGTVHGETPHAAPVVISLADTEAQKVRVQQTKSALPDHTPAASHPAPADKPRGIFSRLFGGSDMPSDAVHATHPATVADASLEIPAEQRDKLRKRKKLSNFFDDHFRKYSKHYFGINTDWRWFQAQAMVESEMKPDTRSNSGAMGLMQIMPRTFQEIRSRNPHLKDPFDPHFSIAAGIYYNRQLYDAWSDISNSDDRRRFMFASYNAGLGTIKRAARSAGNPDSFAVLEPRLATGPRHYLIKIERERRKLGD